MLLRGVIVAVKFADEGRGQRLLAYAGCNWLGSEDLDLSGGTVATSGLGTTLMACYEEDRQEDWLAAFLQDEPDWQLDGDELVLSTGDIRMELLKRSVAEPDLALEGTDWRVVGLVDTETLSVRRGGDSSLVIADGQITVDMECAEFSANAEVSHVDGVVRLLLDGFSSKELACARRAAESYERVGVHDHFQNLLDGEVQATRQGARLCLANRNGTGVELWAHAASDSYHRDLAYEWFSGSCVEPDRLPD